MALGTESASETYTRANTFGSICFHRMWGVPAPTDLAASTKGLSLRLRTCDLIVLAKPIHPKTERTSMMFHIDLPRTKTKTNIRGNVGMTSNMSENLISTSSTTPFPYPATKPTSSPMATDKNAASKPTSNDILVP